MDFSFLGDKPGEEQITILIVVDVLSGMALSVVIPTKARTPYSQAELRRFVLETGELSSVLQTDPDPEPALLAIATSVAGEALRLEILDRHDVDLSVHSALFTWLVRHAQWLVNRYLCNAEGTTAFERCWRKKYAGFICRFCETVIRRRVVQLLCLAFGLARPDQHFVADGSGVFKARSVRPPGKPTLPSVTARPWDLTGSKAETGTFVFPQVTNISSEALSVL
eukprot:s3079_g1.t1